MKVIRGIKIGGLQQKIFNLILFFILALIGIYTAVSIYQQRSLSTVVQQTGEEQQTAIESASEETMQAVLNSSMVKTNALQAYIANDLFSDVQTDVKTLQVFAEGLFEHRESLAPHPFSAPDPAKDGVTSVQMLHEPGVDPNASELLALVANMSEVMQAMYESSGKLNSCFIGSPVQRRCIMTASWWLWLGRIFSSPPSATTWKALRRTEPSCA